MGLVVGGAGGSLGAVAVPVGAAAHGEEPWVLSAGVRSRAWVSPLSGSEGNRRRTSAGARLPLRGQALRWVALWKHLSV